MVTAKLRCYRQSYVWSVLELESCRAMPDHCRDSYLHNLPATSLTGNPLINSRHYTGLALDALFVLLSTLLSCASFVVERPPLRIGCNKFVIPGRWMELCYYSVFCLLCGGERRSLSYTWVIQQATRHILNLNQN